MCDRLSPDPAQSKATMVHAPRGTSDVSLAAAIAEAGVGAAPTQYPGGKNGAGVYQRLINLMPPHGVYVEAFLGSGAILRRKRPAFVNIGIDVDARLIARHAANGRPDFMFLHANAVDWLSARDWEGDELVYCDPPYLGSVRARPGRNVYRCEMMGEEEHRKLLVLLTTIPAMVMISGYASPLYDELLAGWQRVEYPAMTRGGLVTEVIWMNYPPPVALHDYQFLGRDFHDRCRIGRKIGRWRRKLAALPVLERAAVLAVFGDARSPASSPPTGGPARG